jgi:hypothetical protein
MVKSEVMKILAVISEMYQKFEVNEVKGQLFFELLGDLEYAVVQMAVKKYMLTSEFPPTVADIRKLAIEIINPDMLVTGADAWGEVTKAMQNYGSWRVNEALESMNEKTRQVVKCIGFQNICMTENIDVMRGQFMKMYSQVDERSKTEMLLPPTLNEQIKALGQGMKMIGGTNNG